MSLNSHRNEQFVLPLMLTLMTARIVGGLFNDDLYHIHIHMKKGVNFLEAELRSVTRHHKYVHFALFLPAMLLTSKIDASNFLTLFFTVSLQAM